MSDVAASLAMHDELLARRSVDVWVGAVPAFALSRASRSLGRMIGPCRSARAFAEEAEAEWQAAEIAGLAALHHLDNGEPSNAPGFSLVLGGERPSASPFARYPHVVPALVRYLNNHPALSYWFAGPQRGARPDEGAREQLDELDVALGWIEWAADRGEPVDLMTALAPLLGDSSELKLRSDGGIELPAIRMPERPEMLAALASLFRSIVARLVVAHYREPLIDWHDELHDRFALPAALHRDLRLVLGDLDEHRLGVPAELRVELEAWRAAPIACRLGDATLELRPALEFVPDVQRWELAIDGAGPDRVVVAGRWAALRELGGGVRAIGVRRGVVAGGLVPAIDPLVVEWTWAGRAQRIELWASRPGGDAYSEPPRDATDAQRRRTERISVTSLERGVEAARAWRETNPFTIDLRRVTVDA